MTPNELAVANFNSARARADAKRRAEAFRATLCLNPASSRKALAISSRRED
jgi:hypothetical protein